MHECMNLQNMSSPLILKLVKGTKRVFCGAISFEGEEGQVLVPRWMLQQLSVERDGSVTVYVMVDAITAGLRAVFQPLSSHFLTINNPRAVLERTLRNYACISLGDPIILAYNGQEIEMLVRESNSNATINITECDLRVDFMPPPDYKDESIVEPVEHYEETFAPFVGSGSRLDGRPLSQQSQSQATPERKLISRGVPDYHFQLGVLKFRRRPCHVAPPPMAQVESEPFESEETAPKRLRWSEEVIHTPMTRNQTRLALLTSPETTALSVVANPPVLNNSTDLFVEMSLFSVDDVSEQSMETSSDSDDPPPLTALFSSPAPVSRDGPQSPSSEPPQKKSRRSRRNRNKSF